MADLVAAVAGGRPDDGLLRLAEGAAGNPLYVTELVAALARSASLTVTEAGAAELAGDTAPGSLSAAIADRLGFVTGPVREVLRAAALLGVDFTVTDLAIVLRRGVPDLVQAIDEACAVGVLTESRQRLEFRHPLIRAALYDEMPGPVRAAWHRDAGRALAEASAPADRVARQLLRAAGEPEGPPGPMDEWILDWLARTCGLPGRPGTGGRRRAPDPGRERLDGRYGAAQLAVQPPCRRPLPDGRYRRGRAGGQPRAGVRHRTRCRRGPALDAGAVPDAGGRGRGAAGRAGAGAGRARHLGPAPRPADGAGRAYAPAHGRGRGGGPGGRQRARGGDRGGRQLGHGLGAARADDHDRGAGTPGGHAAAVRPGAGRDPGRRGAERPAAAAADQPGRHLRQPRPVRRGAGRGRPGPAAGQPGRHGDAADAGALRAGPAAVRDRALGRRAGRGDGHGRGPQGTRGRLLRPQHRGRHLLPPRRDRRGAAVPGRGRPVRRADRPSAHRHAGPGPQPGPRVAGRAARGPGRADRRVRPQQRGARGDRGPAGRCRPARRPHRRPDHRAGPGRPRRHPRGQLGCPAPAGERAVLPGPARPRWPRSC